jgi:hypothetical protein
MFLASPETIRLPDDSGLESLPNRPAVFLIRAGEGAGYLARTTLLRRRLLRLLRERTGTSRLLNLRAIATRVEYWLTGSQLESSLLYYEAARRHFPESYLKLLKLRMPPYVKIILSNPFPRSQITTRLSSVPALYYGPFRNRSAAEAFQNEFLGLFQMRRCEADLAPSPDFPGCIYGEMNMCLRPCQQVVSREEYASEVDRAAGFLSTGGRSLLATIASARDRFSEELNFEEAARQHKRFEKVQQVLKLRDELACDIDRLNGVAVTRSIAPNSVELWRVLAGCWQPPERLSFEVVEGKPASLDHKLRDIMAVAQNTGTNARAAERQEQLALLARWFYSSWREGEWIPFEEAANVPYRRLVRAVSRVSK